MSELPFLAVETDAFAADPFPEFARARAAHPWLARWSGGYVITDCQAIRDLYAMEAQGKWLMPYAGFAALFNADGTPWGEFQKRHMLSMGGAQHARVRSLLAPAFTPRQANAHRPLMRQTISELLDQWAPRQSFDFEEFASWFPITVMCRLIGADPAVIPGLRDAMEAIGLSASMDPRFLPAMQQGVVTMEAFVDGLIAQRRAAPRAVGEPDLLDLLLGFHAQGGLDDRELADLLIFLFVAGYDTSKNMLTLTMRLLLENPESYRRCATDHDFARRVVEESFRYASTTATTRIAADTVTYRDVTFPEGTLVLFPMSVATHDPRYTDAADRFDPDAQRTVPHIGFGLGAHMCLGQYIARAQIHEGLHLIARRLLDPTSPGPQGFRPFPGAWGITGLPITFTDAKEPAA
ncbi:MAG: cytochrome P450 [Sphingomonadales bacterium]|nr:cytochrome P450 [Sphingomonadales bacterium]